MKVLQFGQGNFLRTFADVYFETLNQEGLDYQVYVATAIPHENLEAFRPARATATTWCCGALRGGSRWRRYCR